MKLVELRAALAKVGPTYDHREVKIWLPGSTISLAGVIGPSNAHGQQTVVLIEGNVDEGSALDSLVEERGRPG